MRCCLLQPPLCDPSCPPLGLAYLSALLEKKGVKHEIFDLNIDFIDFIEAFVPKNPDCQQRYDARQRIQIAFETLGKLFPAICMEPYILDIPEAGGRLAEICEHALDPKGLFSAWIREKDPVSDVLSSDPEWIGISVSFFGQLPAALAIAAACKRKSMADVVFGGALFKDFETWLGPGTPFWNDVTGVVVGAGEDILCSFFKADNGRVLPALGRTDLPGGVWIAKSTKRIAPPRPDFGRFPLQRYRAAGLVLPYRVYSCCTWGKCTFCADAKYAAHLPAVGGQAKAVAVEIENMAAKYGAEGIYFLDAELPEQFMSSFAHYLSYGQSGLRWGSNARFSPGLADPTQAENLYDGGCRFLRFGLESASPRVLKLMKKGIDSALAEGVLTAVHQAGIATHVYLMHAFPSETEEDWRTTVDFLLRNASRIDMFNISIFQLYDGSPLCRSLDSNLFRFTASQDCWVHPQIKLNKTFQKGFQDIERAFFKLKKTTRCHPTPSDTIILGDSSPLRFGRNALKTGEGINL